MANTSSKRLAEIEHTNAHVGDGHVLYGFTRCRLMLYGGGLLYRIAPLAKIEHITVTCRKSKCPTPRPSGDASQH